MKVCQLRGWGRGSLFLGLSPGSQRPLGPQDTALDPLCLQGFVPVNHHLAESHISAASHLPSLLPLCSYHGVHSLPFVFFPFSCCQDISMFHQEGGTPVLSAPCSFHQFPF